MSPEYVGQVRRGGRWLSVSRGARGVALSRGLNVARSSLAASVRVVPTGRFVDVPDVGVSLRGFGIIVWSVVVRFRCVMSLFRFVVLVCLVLVSAGTYRGLGGDGYEMDEVA